MQTKLLPFILGFLTSLTVLGQTQSTSSDDKVLHDQTLEVSTTQATVDTLSEVSRNTVSKDRLAEVALRGSGLRPEDIDFIKNYKQRFQKKLINLKNDKSVILKFIEYALLSNGIPRELKA